jgi:hypothetical protein
VAEGSPRHRGERHDADGAGSSTSTVDETGTREAAGGSVRRGLPTPQARHFIVGMTNSAPSFTPEGQREVTVLVLV